MVAWLLLQCSVGGSGSVDINGMCIVWAEADCVLL